MRPLLACLLLASPALAQRPTIPDGTARAEPSADSHRARDKASPIRLSHRESRIRASQYEQADHWSVQSIVLAGLGVEWHPVAVPAVLSALTGKDDRLQAQALEVLRRMEDDALRAVATPELVEALIKQGFKESNDLWQERLVEVLSRIFPDADAEKRSEWSNVWRQASEGYAPAPWSGPDDPDGHQRRSSASAADRALDLASAGLEICFAIDATGSMQPAIDAVVASAQETSSILEGFATELRLATVIYRDLEDMPGGSDVVEPLTKNLARAYKGLDKIVAAGGGDPPEAIEAGLESALSIDDLGWTEEANKLVIVMGDAPAHASRLEEALELASKASADMGAARGSTEKRRKLERRGRKTAPRSGPRMDARPFVISTIAVQHQPGRSPATDHMRQIAKAGRGLSGTLDVGGAADDGARDLVELVVRMSFGEKYERQVQEFLDVYFEYRAAGLY